MRVLHLTSVESPNYYLNTLAESLHPERAVFSAITLGQSSGFAEELRVRGVQTRSLAVLGRRLRYPLAGLAIATVANRMKADIIHAHLFEPSLLGALVSRASGRPLIISRHHSDAIHRLDGRWRRAAYLRVERFTHRTARHIIAPARMVRGVLTDREGVPPEKVTVIPYPQDPARFAACPPRQRVRREIGAGTDRVLVSVSRLHPEKGLPVLLQALTTLPSDVRLYVVGVGPDRESLEAQASSLGVGSRVFLLGWRTDALAILAAADVVVHPSFHEALPSAVIEGLALGRPVVASDVSGVRDILGDDDFGRVVPPGDVDALARAVSQVLADPQAAAIRAARGRVRLLEYMEPRRVAEAHVDCYRKVLQA